MKKTPLNSSKFEKMIYLHYDHNFSFYIGQGEVQFWLRVQ